MYLGIECSAATVSPNPHICEVVIRSDLADLSNKIFLILILIVIVPLNVLESANIRRNVRMLKL